MANWFIGLPVAPGGWFDRTVDPPPGVRRFHPADVHLTVAFLGAVGEPSAQAAWSALVWPLAATAVTLGDVVPMGPPRRPSAYSALLVEGRREVEEAMGAVRDACCDAAGARRELRPPKAHVTLARPGRSATPSQRAAGEAWAAALALGAPRVILDRLALFTWSDVRGGEGKPQFRVVAERRV